VFSLIIAVLKWKASSSRLPCLCISSANLKFLDQKLIPYCYSSCCCFSFSSCSWWATLFKKAYCSIASNRIGMKFGRIVLQVNTLQLTFETEKCCHPVSAHAASACRISSSLCQFLIHSALFNHYVLYRSLPIHIWCALNRLFTFYRSPWRVLVCPVRTLT